MKMNVKMMAAAMAVLGAVSCSKSDVFDPGQAEEIKKAQEEAKIEQTKTDYENNFVKTYGEIDPNQSWDFSTGDEYFGIPSSSSKAGTRGETPSYTMTKSESYYQVEQSTLNKMNEVFKEGRNNYDTGKKFAMTVPSNDFTIMPIFMGQSGGDFDLYMHVDGIGEILVWRKWEGIQAKFAGSDDWKDLYKEEQKFVGYELSSDWEWVPVYETVRKTTTNGENTKNATAIQSKYITFHGLPAGKTMYFYLKITETATGHPENYNKKGQSLGSVNDFMREYQFGANDLTPANLPGVDEPEVKIIGCEDASTSSMTDKDYNDVVFMLYGEPYVPESFEVEDLEKTVKKRYFVEDLGVSDDTDFNDIVVDVVSTYSYKQTTSNSRLVTFSDEKVTSRKAEIRALGGTLDFELNIGGKTWKKSDNFDYKVMYNTGNKDTGELPDYTKVLHSFDLPLDYDPATNNISVTVYQKDSDKESAKVNFPANGTVPMIIAANAYEEWSVERVAFRWKKFMNEE